MNRIKEMFKDKTILGLGIALLVTVVIILVLVFTKMDFKHETVMVDVSKLKQNEIIEWYKKEFSNDENIEFTKEYSETVNKDDVISQSIKAGEKINKDTKIKIVISKGSDPNLEIKLPDFVKENYNKEKIDKFFQDNKFNDVTYEYEISELEKDMVIKVNVSDKAKRSDLILVTLSIGDDEELIDVTVPDFSTYSLANARAWGKSNRISIRVNYVFSNTHEEGKIISQSVSANETVKGGSTITLQVSNGKGVTIDDLAGMTFKEADKWSDDVGVYIKPIYVYHDTIKENIVIKTDPKPGSIVAKGDVIDLYVSKGVDPQNITVEVEDRVGSSEKEFLDYISSLELKASKSTSYYSDTIQSGSVMSHTTGKIKMSQIVEYNLSLGKYNLNVADFEGRTKAQANQVINSANALKANVKLEISETVNSDNYAKDVLFNCKIDGNKVACVLSNGSLAVVANFVGQNKTEDFTHNNVNYKIVFDTEHKDGTTYGEVYAQSQKEGTRVENGTTVELYVRIGSEQKAQISRPEIYSNLSNSYEETERILRENLGMFKNLVIQRDDNAKLGNGKIVKMTVNGSTDFESGMYPLSTEIVVVVSGRNG